MLKMLEETKASLQKAKDDMKHFYDAHRNEMPDLKPGDKVMVEALNFRTMRPSKKLDYKWYGPYPIIAKVGTHAYQLRLSLSMNRVHPIFHITKLRIIPDNPFNRRNKLPPDPVIVDGNEEYEVEQILDSRRWRN